MKFSYEVFHEVPGGLKRNDSFLVQEQGTKTKGQSISRADGIGFQPEGHAPSYVYVDVKIAKPLSGEIRAPTLWRSLMEDAPKHASSHPFEKAGASDRVLG